MDQQPNPDAKLISEFANDPEMAELVDLFVTELPNRIEAIQAAADSNDSETLKRLAHQLKGAAPGYGFPTIGHAAAEVEMPLKDAPDPDQAIHSITDQVNQLVNTCKAATI